MLLRYRVAEPNAYLVITGAGIDGVAIKKKAFLWPGQKCTKISVTPFDLPTTLQAMTIEKLKFSLPAVFTIGPRDTLESIARYATLLTGESDGTPIKAGRSVSVVTARSHVKDIVEGIIIGEMRSIVSNMTMEELFKDRAQFKSRVINTVQSELDQFGLCIYNANVKELQDSPGSEYFSFLSRKAHEGASNQAKIDVAEARARGEIGEAERQGKTKQEIAKINAATAVLETERKSEKASADAALTNKEIQLERELNLERIAAKRAAESKDTQLQKDVEIKRAEMELERQRATTVTQARISREASEQKAQAELYSSAKKADAYKYNAQAEADAVFARKERETNAAVYKQRQEAEAGFDASCKQAEAKLVSMKAEANGVREMAEAYGQLAHVLGGPQGLLQYLMLKENLYEKLALANAKAVQGMQPKINVWTTGEQSGSSDPAAAIRNIFQTLPPLMSTINEQTGMSPPSWLMQMPNAQEGEKVKTLEQSSAVAPIPSPKNKDSTTKVNGTH